MNPHEQIISRTLARTTYLGLFVNVMIPIAMFIVAMVLTGQAPTAGEGLGLQGNPGLRVLFFTLLAISIIDFVICLVIRKKLPSTFLRVGEGSADENFEKSAGNIALVIYVFNALYTVYGLVLTIMGAQIEVMMLFIAFSLIGYQFLRPRREFLERLLNTIKENY